VTPLWPFGIIELKLKSSHYMRVKAYVTHCGTDCLMRIFDSAARSIFSVIAVSLPWLLLMVLPSILFGQAMAAFLLFGAINGIGLIFLGSVVFVASALRIGRRWWWAMFGACLSANVVYWLIRSIYFPDPPPPGASSLYFEYEPFFALLAIPTALVAMMVGANFDRLFSRVSPNDPQRLNDRD
jgi:hypothetical protein